MWLLKVCSSSTLPGSHVPSNFASYHLPFYRSTVWKLVTCMARLILMAHDQNEWNIAIGFHVSCRGQSACVGRWRFLSNSQPPPPQHTHTSNTSLISVSNIYLQSPFWMDYWHNYYMHILQHSPARVAVTSHSRIKHLIMLKMGWYPIALDNYLYKGKKE